MNKQNTYTTSIAPGFENVANDQLTAARLTVNEAIHSAVVTDGECSDWKHSPAAAECHKWIERFNFRFKLEIGTPVLRIGKLRGRCGHFVYGHNDLGLKHEIAIDVRHFYRGVQSKQDWIDVLDTVLHECLHFFEYIERLKQGRKPPSGNYHTVVFRKKAESLGLLVDERGVSLGVIPNSPFTKLLDEYEVDTSSIQPPERPLRAAAAATKLRLWECHCNPPIKIRIGRTNPPPPLCTGCNTLYTLQPRGSAASSFLSPFRMNPSPLRGRSVPAEPQLGKDSNG